MTEESKETYIVRKLKKVRAKLYQSYLLPFFVDFGFRMGAAVLAGLVGASKATIISISVLTLTRIKAIKDLIDVAKGLVEAERIHDPYLTVKKMFSRDFKTLISSSFKKMKKGKSQTNSVIIIVGALAPMLFDYFSMGIVAKYGAVGAIITQIIDTSLHLGAILILFSSVKKINEKLLLFNEEYYNQFKNFINESLAYSKNLKLILNKENTKYDSEVIRRFLVENDNIKSVIKKSINSQEWEQFYLHFPDDKEKAERSIRKYEDKYIISTKILEKISSTEFSRHVYVVEITKERYEEFKILNGDEPIYNLTCYSIPTSDKSSVLLLDVYKGLFEGLNIVRVKFNNEEDSKLFKVPEWFGKEITNDPDYTGKHFPVLKKE